MVEAIVLTLLNGKHEDALKKLTRMNSLSQF